MNQEMSDLVYPNFAQLFKRALVSLNREGLVAFSDIEAVTVGFITAEELERLDAIGDRVIYEVDELCIPKYVCLAMWLSPHGIASHRPKLASRLANFILGYTRDKEIDRLPRQLRSEMGV
jgi:hypothetical protein